MVEEEGIYPSLITIFVGDDDDDDSKSFSMS